MRMEGNRMKPVGATSSPPKAADFEAVLDALLRESEEYKGRREPYVEIAAKQLHELVGGYPGPDHRMPICCRVMYDAMGPGDRVVQEPKPRTSASAGKVRRAGADLVIRYRVPR